MRVSFVSAYVDHQPIERKSMKLHTIINQSRTLFAFGALFSMTSLGCVQDPALKTLEEVEVPVRYESDAPLNFAASSEIDADTQEPDAFNYTPAPLADAMSVESRSASTDFRDVWSGPKNKVEAKIFVGRHRAIVGVGARVKPGEVTTLRVHARQVMPNGTLGGLREYRGGSEPNHNLEVWCKAPAGHLLTGLGGRIRNDNMTTLRIYYRKYNPNTRKLVGPVFNKGCGTAPNHALERRVVSWEAFTNPARENRAIVTGLSMRELSDNLNSLRLRFRLL